MLETTVQSAHSEHPSMEQSQAKPSAMLASLYQTASQSLGESSYPELPSLVGVSSHIVKAENSSPTIYPNISDVHQDIASSGTPSAVSQARGISVVNTTTSSSSSQANSLPRADISQPEATATVSSELVNQVLH